MPEITLSALDHLIPQIYEAAIQPARWQEVLSQICTVFRAEGGELVNAGILLNQRWVLHNFPEELVKAYVDEMSQADAVVPAIMAQASRGPIAFKFADIPGLMHTPLYDQIVKPFGMASMCMATLGQDSGAGFEFMALGRTKDQPQFDRRTIHGVARLTPHLRSAGVVQMRLDGAGEPFRAVLEGLPSAVLVLNRHGKPLFANHAAEVMLKERDGLSAENGRLTAATSSATAHLQAVIDRAIASQLGAVQTAGEDVILRRPSGKPPFAVHVAPLGRDNPYWARGHRAAVGVFVDDPDRGVPDIAERLRAMFGLTEAEARVASALAEGLSPAEIAKRHGTQTKTVRTQLESIHAKLGVRRQAQAVQRILGVARSFRLQR